MTSPFMTDKEVAAYFNVSRSQVWNLLGKDERFPKPVKLHGATRWLREELDDYTALKAGRHPNPTNQTARQPLSTR